jgi:CcmD family protein
MKILFSRFSLDRFSLERFSFNRFSLDRFSLDRFSFLVSRLGMFILMMILSKAGIAQTQQVEMADGMRSNGKIYIVVAVCLTILIGLFLYVFSIDRKLKKLEKER